MKLYLLERILPTCLVFISAPCLVSLDLIIASSIFISKPPNVVVGTYGGSVTFKWEISGNILERKWKYGGKLIAKVNSWNDTEEDVNIDRGHIGRVSFPFGSPELTLKDLTFSDEGEYTCDVLLDGGVKFFDKTQLIIYVYPTFGTSLPPTVVVLEYKDVSFACSVRSTPAANITWSHAGSKIFNDATRHVNVSNSRSANVTNVTSTLLLKNVRSSHRGKYHCIAAHYFGVFNKSTTLQVHSLPVITSFPKDDIYTTESSATVHINCQVTGFPLPTVSWYKDNDVINPSHLHYDINSIIKQKYSTWEESFVNSTLTINNIEKSDFGVYTCEGTSALFEIGSQRINNSVYVFVNYPPILLANSTRQNVSLFSNGFELSCEAKAYPPVSEYKWSKDGVAMLHNKRVYKVAKPNKTSQGTYKCTPKNNQGIGRTVTHVITVLGKPEVTVPATCLPEDGKLYCSCGGVGNPPLQIYWTKSPSKQIISHSNTLNISINSNASGMYTCHMKNANGVTSSSHQVTALFIQQSAGMYWHKDWYILFWVLIPLLVILILFFLIWASRKQNNSSKAVFVSTARSIRSVRADTGAVPPTIRSLQTHPDIYLPQRGNSVTNGGYHQEDKDRLENQEVMEKFVESEVEDEPDQPYDVPPVFYHGPRDENERKARWSEDDQNLIHSGNAFLHLYDYVSDPPSSREGMLSSHIDAPAQFCDDIQV